MEILGPRELQKIKIPIGELEEQAETHLLAGYWWQDANQVSLYTSVDLWPTRDHPKADHIHRRVELWCNLPWQLAHRVIRLDSSSSPCWLRSCLWWTC